MKKTNHYEICKAKLQYLNYSPKTQSTYLHYIEQFLNATKIPPSRLTSQDFQSYLDNFNFTSKSKSHKRQSQILNLIEQRLRVAHKRAKDTDTKERLKRAHDYIKSKCEASKKKTQRLKEAG